MAIKIYFGNKPLILHRERNEEIDRYMQEGALTIESAEADQIQQIVRKMGEANTKAGIILVDPEQSFPVVARQFRMMQAAGGLVHDGLNQILLIYRRGKWDLPKGKLDEGEELEKCAVREVEEETGLKNITLNEKLIVTYHTYAQDQQSILKESHWYLMQADSKQVLTPQTDEDIEKCEWVPIESMAPYMENSLPSIVEVVTEGIKQLKTKKAV